ncbi:MAG: peptidyl-alpha-hydroxyglycine alpha-amidating lyase family protein [Chloroflexota bacterium]|nr:peptidyl-alpha-hydroxyglycine alpha-amidating lyase family protein [Chloroflexota bacterium]
MNVAPSSTVSGQEHRYTHDASWGALPAGWTEWGFVPSVVVDSQDRVYVHHRAPRPVVVYSRTGELLSMWGDQFEKGAHGLHLRQEADGEYLYFTDVARHCVVKCTLDGRELWTLGSPGQVGAAEEPFNRPTDIAFTPQGDFYVSDGYGNSRVHHYDPDRKLIRSWGEPGSGPGQFKLVHDVWFDTRGASPGAPGRLWVCDRENYRIQIFTPAGEFIEEKTGFQRPNGMWVDSQGYMYVAELLNRVTILDPQDRVVGHIGGRPSREPGELLKPHAIWGDSHGDLYIAEVEDGARIQKFVRS